MRDIHLICNAHLDPVWQWEWQEGLAEALSTFRIAADFCEQQDGFVFNHNEAVLYQWVEEYDPSLFARIQSLVREGRWHIMGGWYLQPDCNIPGGESIWRQILAGRRYFSEKFGVSPTIAMNVDSFGHSRGLVQLLKKTGYDGYLVGRPAIDACGAPGEEFCWVGYDGSEITVHLTNVGYNSFIGHAADKIRDYCASHPGDQPLMILWGIGDHGGGPSKVDLCDLDALKEQMAQEGTGNLIHSTPETYFSLRDKKALPRYTGDLNPSMPGCYTTQVCIKQAYSRLESHLLMTEKMATAAQLQTGLPVDTVTLRQAEECLLFHSFHDILPGTSIKRAETASLRAMGGALSMLDKMSMRCFAALAKNVPAPEPDTIPMLIYNPHPHPVDIPLVCEFHLADQNRSGTFTSYHVYQDGKEIPMQMEKEDSNVPIDWRKRLTVQPTLAPSSLTVLNFRPEILPHKPALEQQSGEEIVLNASGTKLSVSTVSGWITCLETDGHAALRVPAGQLMAVKDNEDSWMMTTDRIAADGELFRVASPEETAQIAGVRTPLAPVRIVEQGPIRTVVEAIFVYRNSHAIVRYSLDSKGVVRVWIRLFWTEKDTAVKWCLPAASKVADCTVQDIFGAKTLRCDGSEDVMQHWAVLGAGEQAVRVINTGVYGCDYRNGQLRMTLLRSPGYCAHPFADYTILPQDRWSPRTEQGEREYLFVIGVGERSNLLSTAERDALTENQPPMAIPMFTAGNGEVAEPLVEIDHPSVVMTACRPLEDGCILHLYHAADGQAKTIVRVAGMETTLCFNAYEVKAIRCENGRSTELDLLEK